MEQRDFESDDEVDEIDMTEDEDARLWLQAGVTDWALRDEWMPPALFRGPYVLSFASQDLEQYIVTRGWNCEAGLSRSELLDVILKSLHLEGRRVDWAVHTRRAGRMNLREKPPESEKRRERDKAPIEGDGKTGKDSPSRYLEG